MTVFLSSHILSEIQRNCNRAAIIRDGEIIACGSVEELSKTNAKRVSLHGRFDIDGLEGVKDIQESADGTAFLYNGSMNGLVSALSKGDIKDLTISDPDLEEIFMHYYTGGSQL